MELPISSPAMCIVGTVICFLMVRGKGLPLIYHQICDNRPVISAKADKAMIYLTSVLLYLRRKFLMNFIILVILAISRPFWNITCLVLYEWLVIG